MADKADNELITKFREDVKLLKPTHTQLEIGNALGIGKGNFSKYLKTLAPPREKIILFYEIYGQYLKKYQAPSGKPTIINEPQEPYEIDLVTAVNALRVEVANLIHRQDQQEKIIKQLLIELGKSKSQPVSGKKSTEK